MTADKDSDSVRKTTNEFNASSFGELKTADVMGKLVSQPDQPALGVLGEVDFQRRGLPASDVKRALRESRLSSPVGQTDGTWLVYQMDDGIQIYYSPETSRYRLVGPDLEPVELPDVQALADHLTTARS